MPPVKLVFALIFIVSPRVLVIVSLLILILPAVSWLTLSSPAPPPICACI